ncbi:MAG: AraC family transcriptional regulator [Rhizobiaceae bacterium]|nr:AraC family transcriptional regulator [Rhizobiaceae bacterium]
MARDASGLPRRRRCDLCGVPGRSGMSGVAMQRVGPMCSVPAVAESFGHRIEPVLEAAGLPHDALNNPDNLLPFSKVGEILEAAARLCECPHFGLLVGARNDHKGLGPVGQLMAHAPTLGDAIIDFTSNQHRNSRGAVVYLMRVLDSYFFGYAIYNRFAEGSRHIYDLCAAIGVNTVRELAGPAAAPLEVLICHQPPGDRRPYRAILGPNVSFNQAQTALVLSPAHLKLPVLGADREMHAKLAARVAELRSMGTLDFASHVRHLLKPKLLLGQASREGIAKQVGTHVRTLQRRLREASTTYRELEQQMRFSVACELLEITDLQISDISAALDYASPSAFDRAFSRWTGLTPTNWRDQRIREQKSA